MKSKNLSNAINYALETSTERGIIFELSSLHSRNKNNELQYSRGLIIYSEYVIERNLVIKSLESVVNRIDLVLSETEPDLIEFTGLEDEKIKVIFFRRKEGERLNLRINKDIPVHYLINKLLRHFQEKSLIDVVLNNDNLSLSLMKKKSKKNSIRLNPALSLTDNNINDGDELFLKFSLTNETYLTK